MLRRPRRAPAHDAPANGAVAFEPRELTGFFSTPQWLRDLGMTAWLLVGVTLMVVAVVWLLSLTATIVLPVIAAAVIAAVASPLVSWLERRHLGRGAATALLLVGAIALGVGLVVLIVAGISGQHGDLSRQLTDARSTITGWLNDLGVDPSAAKQAGDDASSALSKVVPQLLHGLGAGLTKLSSLAFFLALTALSLFFLLKDGPLIRRWAEGHMRVSPVVAHGITGRLLQSLRGYFVGVTFVALFNAVLVLIGALILGVPLAGTIALVTFLGAYIPYLGAWGAGAFAVLIALGGAGTDAAIGMAIIQLLANGILQQLVQPVAYGAALGIHPLAVLVVTIGGGSLFGAVGLILAAPLTSAVTRITADLAHARAAAEAEAHTATEQETTPAPPSGAPDLAPS